MARYMQCGCVTEVPGLPDFVEATEAGAFALARRFYTRVLSRRAEPQLSHFYMFLALDELSAVPPEQDLPFYHTASRSPHYDVPHRLQVNKDIPRTFANYSQFQLEADVTDGHHLDPRWQPDDGVLGDSLLPSLQKVLMAVVARFPESGYTQGLNFVAAVLLLEHGESATFAWLCRIVLQFPGTFGSSGGLSAVRVETQLIDALLTKTKVGQHLHAHFGDVAMFTTQWLVGLFTTVFSLRNRCATRVLNFVISLDCSAERAKNRPARLALACFVMAAEELTGTADPAKIVALLRALPSRLESRLSELLELAENDAAMMMLMQPSAQSGSGDNASPPHSAVHLGSDLDKVVSAERAVQQAHVAAEEQAAEQLRTMLLAFKAIDTDNSRSLDLVEFENFVGQFLSVGPASTAGGGSWRRLARSLFMAADTDNNGSVSFGEFKKATLGMNPLLALSLPFAALRNTTGLSLSPTSPWSATSTPEDCASAMAASGGLLVALGVVNSRTDPGGSAAKSASSETLPLELGDNTADMERMAEEDRQLLLCRTSSEGFSAALFEHFDRDGDGCIDRDQLSALVGEIYRAKARAAAAVAPWTKSYNGHAAESEATRLALLAVDVNSSAARLESDAIFDMADVDHDGRISSAEFVAAAATMPCLVVGQSLLGMTKVASSASPKRQSTLRRYLGLGGGRQSRDNGTAAAVLKGDTLGKKVDIRARIGGEGLASPLDGPGSSRDLTSMAAGLFSFGNEADDDDHDDDDDDDDDDDVAEGDDGDLADLGGGRRRGELRRSTSCRESAAGRTLPFSTSRRWQEPGAKPSLLDLSDVSDMTADELSGGGWDPASSSDSRPRANMAAGRPVSEDSASSLLHGQIETGEASGGGTSSPSPLGTGSGIASGIGSSKGGRWRACACASARPKQSLHMLPEAVPPTRDT